MQYCSKRMKQKPLWIIGIVTGIAVIIGGIIALAVCCCLRGRQKQTTFTVY
jgi:hypothetical protein